MIVVHLLLLGSGLIFNGASCGPQGEAETENTIFQGNAETWKHEVEKNNSQKEAIVAGLIRVATDRRRENDDRIDAIILLGKLQTSRAIDYLLTNVSMRIVPTDLTGDEDIFKATPCAYTLASMGWNAVPHILRYSSRKEWDRKTVGSLGNAISEAIQAHYAVPLLKTAAHQADDDRSRENLTALAEYLQ